MNKYQFIRILMLLAIIVNVRAYIIVCMYSDLWVKLILTPMFMFTMWVCSERILAMSYCITHGHQRFSYGLTLFKSSKRRIILVLSFAPNILGIGCWAMTNIGVRVIFTFCLTGFNIMMISEPADVMQRIAKLKESKK